MNRRKREAPPTPPAWRNRCILACFAFAAIALEVRLGWLQLVEAEFLTAQGEQRWLRTVEMPVHRAQFRDRRGEPLAVSTPVESIYVNPGEIPLDRERIYALAAAVGRDGSELEGEIMNRRDREFLWVERGLAPADAAAALALDIEGVGARREYKRFWPHTEVTCQLIGFTDTDDRGIEGLERLYDAQLTGEPGLKRVLRDERGRVIADVDQLVAPRPGRDVTLSIDLRLQYTAYRELKQAVTEHGASWGSLVLLDIETGEVLAMVNQPACNPNEEVRASIEAFRNRAVIDTFEPGSTLKPLVLAAALGTGRYTPDTYLDVPDVLELAGRSIRSEHGPLGRVTVTEILARSSNLGMVLIGRTLEPQTMWQTFTDFGLGWTDSVLGDIESKGKLEDPGYWHESTHQTLSYGYGLSVTTLQLARAYAAIGSGGRLPRISIEPLDSPPESRQAIDADIAADLMAMLEVVVEDGTGRRAAIPNYRVAGKTGTAKIPVPGGYSPDRTHTVFAGIAPASRPRFAAVVVIGDPRGVQREGGQVAAPVFSRVVGTALRMYAIAPDATDAESTLMSRAEVER